MDYSSDNYLKHTHPNTFYQCTHLRFLRRLETVARQTRPQSVLEVGCGEGFVLDYLVKRQPDRFYAGLDLNPEAVGLARRITARGIQYACAHGGKVPCADQSFDLVILSEVLEHIPTPEVALKEALRLSRAYVLISVPLEPYFRSLSRLFTWLKIGRDPGHVNFWTGAGLRRWLAPYAGVVHSERCDLYQLVLCRPLNRASTPAA